MKAVKVAVSHTYLLIPSERFRVALKNKLFDDVEQFVHETLPPTQFLQRCVATLKLPSYANVSMLRKWGHSNVG